MLKIRKQQQESVAIASFAQRLQDHWISSFSHKLINLTKAQVYQLALEAIKQADQRGIENEEDIVTWADLCLVSITFFAQDIGSFKKNK